MALDRMALILKVGDQTTKQDLQYKTIKEGFPISLITERDWGQTLEEIFSDDTRRVFGIVEVNPLLESYYMDLLQPLNPDKEDDPSLFRSRKKVLPLANLATKIGSSDLVEKLRSETESVPMIDGRALVVGDFLDAEKYTTPDSKIADKNAISSGTYYIGSGETYTTFAAFGADLTTLTGNLTGIQTSNVTETSVATFSNLLATYKLEVKSDAESYGNPSEGYVTSINHTGNGIAWNTSDAGGTLELHKFYLKSIGSASTVALLNIAGSFDSDILIHDIMLDGNATHRYCMIVNASTSPIKAWNLLAWDAAIIPVSVLNTTTDSIYEHITTYGPYGFGGPNAACTLRNNVSFSAPGNWCYTNMTSVTMTSCASTDATGTAGLINLTDSAQFESLDDTNSEFLNITVGSTIDGAGTTSILTENTQGIRKNARPNSNSEVSCGATESMPSGDIINLRGGFGSSLVGGFQ